MTQLLIITLLLCYTITIISNRKGAIYLSSLEYRQTMNEVITVTLIFDRKLFYRKTASTMGNVSGERFTGLSRDTPRFLSCDRVQKKDECIRLCITLRLVRFLASCARIKLRAQWSRVEN